MAEFMATTACNHPRLKDHKAVQKIIDNFYIDPDLNFGVGFDDQDGKPYLFAYGYGWPEAWKIPGGLAPENFHPYEEDEDGADGFNQLLNEIAPHLAEPLVIQAVGATKCRFPLSGCEWRIKPGGRGVQVNEFRGDVEPVRKPKKKAKVAAR